MQGRFCFCAMLLAESCSGRPGQHGLHCPSHGERHHSEFKAMQNSCVPSRAITCHHLPWRAMTCHDVPWSHDVMKSADCQVLTARCTKSFQDADYLRCAPCEREMDGKRWNTLQHLRICWKVIHPFWRNLFKQDKYGANSESMLALSVHPEAIASGFASSVGGPETAVENGR